MFWLFGGFAVVWGLVAYFTNDFYYYITAGIFVLLAIATLVWEYIHAER